MKSLLKFQLNPKNPIFLSAMAGITFDDFAIKAANAGAGAISIGGFCIDEKTYNASKLMNNRNRTEFSFTPDNLIDNLLPNFLESVKDIPIFINIRFIDFKALNRLLTSLESFSNVIPEINAHCRQPEMVNLGIGQNLLHRLDLLHRMVGECKDRGYPVSIKIRGNDSYFKQLMQDDSFNDFINNPNYLHIDAYKQDQNCTDLNLLTAIREKYPGFLIGNNSIIDAKSTLRVLEKGIDAVSIGRAAQHNLQIFQQIWNQIKNKLPNDHRYFIKE